MKRGLGITEAAYLHPLLYGLGTDQSPFQLHADIPARLALQLRDRTPPLEGGCAFLSPIDYARYGAEYCIVPFVGVSSSTPTGTILLHIKPNVRNISTVAVDIRVTSEIILAKIILTERVRHVNPESSSPHFIPMLPDLDAMLAKADAALTVQLAPSSRPESQHYAMDLVEEWHDMTGLPYLHGFWVGRENEVPVVDIQHLIRAKQEGIARLPDLARSLAARAGISLEQAAEYFASFQYDFGTDQQESLSEFIRYAYYHGILQDIPDINFFDVDEPPTLARN